MSVPALFESTEAVVPAQWARAQRQLIDLMNDIAPKFVRRYTRNDGTLVWRDEWPGMDGSDDAYESFWSFPLLYALGGSEEVHELARREWNALTWQFTQYGQVHNEYDAYYDWMHHGESSTYIYYYGLADPYVHQDRERALRFAGMYIGEDPEAQNWDPVHKMIRSPINGSRGPIFEMSAEDWVTHRDVLANYLSPYEDVPGLDPNDPKAIADWNDDEAFGEVLKRMNGRMVPGDVPLNLNATSLVTSAYMYTGDEKYRRWVLDYVEAWAERAKRNGGVVPDNVGPNDEIGERMDGKWWGGYYGWRWPHGSMNILESTLIGGSNALLLTGDDSYLDLHRSQWDYLWELGKERDGVFQTPHRHGEVGWFDYRVPNNRYPLHLYCLTRKPEDRERLMRCGELPTRSGFSKGGQYVPFAWFDLVDGGNAGVADEMLAATYVEMCRRLNLIRHDDGDPAEWDVHHWQDLNPVVCEPLAQLTTGSPGAIYHGGLLHAAVRYFDPAAERPGLPDGVSALVSRVSDGGITVTLSNTDLLEARDVIVQAGAFAEHEFVDATVDGVTESVDGRHFTVRLAAASELSVDLTMKRHANAPTYDFPWPV